MTFYEAALQILLREGKPLHATAITEMAIKENLLSHVGKQPEITMASRLAAMARRSQDRRLVAVEPDTFGLTDWSVAGSDEALEKSGVVETPDEGEPLLRGRERHPRIDKENVRMAGRGDRRRKYEELERKKKKKKKRLPPLAELVYDVVDRAGRALPIFDLASAIRAHDLIAEDIGREALENALRAENERREGEGRSPVFAFPEGGLVGLSGRSEPEEEADLAALVEKVVSRLAEERKPAAVEAPAPVAAAAGTSIDQLAAAERERAVTQLRQRLLDLEAGPLEAVAQTMLDGMGFRDVRVAKRHKEGSLFTCRRRMGLTEVRYAVRVIRGGRDVRREDVLELRRDLQSHSAQVGVLLSPADPTREARSEAAQAGGALVTLLCADALADQLAERGLGVRQRTVTFTEFDPAAFRGLAQAAPAAAAGAPEVRRETASERRERRERERREWREKRAREREERRRAREAAAAAEASAAEGDVGLAERAVAHDAEQQVPAQAGNVETAPRSASVREPALSDEAFGDTDVPAIALAEAAAAAARMPESEEPQDGAPAAAEAAPAAPAAPVEEAAPEAVATEAAPAEETAPAAASTETAPAAEAAPEAASTETTPAVEAAPEAAPAETAPAEGGAAPAEAAPGSSAAARAAVLPEASGPVPTDASTPEAPQALPAAATAAPGVSEVPQARPAPRAEEGSEAAPAAEATEPAEEEAPERPRRRRRRKSPAGAEAPEAVEAEAEVTGAPGEALDETPGRTAGGEEPEG